MAFLEKRNLIHVRVLLRYCTIKMRNNNYIIESSFRTLFTIFLELFILLLSQKFIIMARVKNVCRFVKNQHVCRKEILCRANMKCNKCAKKCHPVFQDGAICKPCKTDYWKVSGIERHKLVNSNRKFLVRWLTNTTVCNLDGCV